MHLQHHLGQSVTGKYFYNMGESDTLGFNLLVNVPIDFVMCVCYWYSDDLFDECATLQIWPEKRKVFWVYLS